MRAILISKREYFGDSLLLEVLFENGEIHSVKLPGILKSKKRYQVYMVSSIWEFKFDNLKPSVLVPRESNLISLPITLSPAYDDLLRLADLMQPTKMLLSGVAHLDIYNILFTILTKWSTYSILQQDAVINFFYIFILENTGHFSIEQILMILSTNIENINNYIFKLGEGIVGDVSMVHSNDSLPCIWLLQYHSLEVIHEYPLISIDKGIDTQCRSNILYFLNNS